MRGGGSEKISFGFQLDSNLATAMSSSAQNLMGKTGESVLYPLMNASGLPCSSRAMEFPTEVRSCADQAFRAKTLSQLRLVGSSGLNGIAGNVVTCLATAREVSLPLIENDRTIKHHR